jgi:hypothetical protein
MIFPKVSPVDETRKVVADQREGLSDV